MNQSVLDNIEHIKNQPCYKECESLIDSNVFYGAVYKRISINTKSLILSLYQNNDTDTIEILKQYIGLGVGLTSSGDDFLSGLAYISYLKNNPNHKLFKLLHDLKKEVRKETNIISFTQFTNALNGIIRTDMCWINRWYTNCIW